MAPATGTVRDEIARADPCPRRWCHHAVLDGVTHHLSIDGYDAELLAARINELGQPGRARWLDLMGGARPHELPAGRLDDARQAVERIEAELGEGGWWAAVRIDTYRKAVRSSPDLTTAEKLLLLNFAECMDFETLGGAHPGKARLARETSVHPNSVTRLVQSVVAN